MSTISVVDETQKATLKPGFYWIEMSFDRPTSPEVLLRALRTIGFDSVGLEFEDPRPTASAKVGMTSFQALSNAGSSPYGASSLSATSAPSLSQAASVAPATSPVGTFAPSASQIASRATVTSSPEPARFTPTAPAPSTRIPTATNTTVRSPDAAAAPSIYVEPRKFGRTDPGQGGGAPPPPPSPEEIAARAKYDQDKAAYDAETVRLEEEARAEQEAYDREKAAYDAETARLEAQAARGGGGGGGGGGGAVSEWERGGEGGSLPAEPERKFGRTRDAAALAPARASAAASSAEPPVPGCVRINATGAPMWLCPPGTDTGGIAIGRNAIVGGAAGGSSFRFMGQLGTAIDVRSLPGLRWTIVHSIAFDPWGPMTFRLTPHELVHGQLYDLRFLSRDKTAKTKKDVLALLTAMGFNPASIFLSKRNMHIPGRPLTTLSEWFGVGLWMGPDSVIVSSDPFYFAEVRPTS